MRLTEHLAGAICSLYNRKYSIEKNKDDAQYMLDKWFGKNKFYIETDEKTGVHTIFDSKTKKPAEFYK